MGLSSSTQAQASLFTTVVTPKTSDRTETLNHHRTSSTIAIVFWYYILLLFCWFWLLLLSSFVSCFGFLNFQLGFGTHLDINTRHTNSKNHGCHGWVLYHAWHPAFCSLPPLLRFICCLLMICVWKRVILNILLKSPCIFDFHSTTVSHSCRFTAFAYGTKIYGNILQNIMQYIT